MKFTTHTMIQSMVAAAVLFSAVPLAAQFGPTPVRVLSVTLEPLEAHRKVVGTLRAVSEAEVAAREEGAVLSVYYREGETVNQGDVLAKLDDRRLLAQIQEAKASITEAESLIKQYQAEFEEAQFDFKNAKELFARDAVSESDVVSAERAIGVVESQISASREALLAAKSRQDLLEVRLGDMVITAPFDGVVTERHLEVGEWVDPGDPVMTVLLRGKLEAWISIPERFSKNIIGLNNQVTIEVPAVGDFFNTEKTRTISKVDERSRTFTLIAEVDDMGGTIKPGMSVNSWVPMGDGSQQITVSRDAVIQDQTGAYVFRIVQPQGADPDAAPIAEKVPVSVLFAKGNKIAVSTSQLVEGDSVIVEGNERLFPNSEVSVIQAEERTLAEIDRPDYNTRPVN
ncbi:MAG: efflux RND transporter periplasmic adaptor subunit [Sumerlaeia bacterium]